MRLPRFRLDPAAPHFRRDLERALQMITDAVNVGEVQSGPSTARPVGDALRPGRLYYDTTLGKLILFNGSAWVNVNGSAL